MENLAPLSPAAGAEVVLLSSVGGRREAACGVLAGAADTDSSLSPVTRSPFSSSCLPSSS